MSLAVDTAVGTNSKWEAAIEVEKTLLERTDNPTALIRDNVPLRFGQLTQDARALVPYACLYTGRQFTLAH